MDTKSPFLTLALVLVAFSAGLPDAAFAFSGLGVNLDTLCSGLAPAAKPPQQSRPFSAKGCPACHNTNPHGSPTDPNLCINTAPNGAAITAPAADGTTVSPGATVSFSGTGTDPDFFGLSFAWSFSNGVSLTGPNVNLTVPANAPAGTITATLTVTDPNGAAATLKPTRSVTVSVAPPPVANADSYTVQSGQTLTVAAPGVLANDSNPSGTGTLTAQMVSGTHSGTLNLNANGGFTYTPVAGFSGNDTFSYRSGNGTSNSAAATVTISVSSGTARAPFANADSYTTATGRTLTVAAPGVLANDSNPSGTGTLTARLVTNPASGNLVFNTNGGFSFTPAANFTGTASFTYQASNGSATSAAATVTISVTGTTTGATCTDRDGDGYSRDGGSCGPIDCNDNNRAVNPAAQESCRDRIDNDCDGLRDAADPECSGKDCVGKLLKNQLIIDSARWDGEEALKVRGSKAARNATVRLSDAARGIALGTTRVRSDGTWTFERKNLRSSPCRIKAVIGNASAERAVTGAPASCPGSAASAASAAACPGEDHDRLESDDDHRSTDDSRSRTDDD